MNFAKSERVSPSFGHQRISSNALPSFGTIRPLQLSSNIIRKKSVNTIPNLASHLIIDASPEMRNLNSAKPGSTRTIFTNQTKKKSLISPKNTLENATQKISTSNQNFYSAKENITINDQKQRNSSRSEHQNENTSVNHQKTKSFQPKQVSLNLYQQQQDQLDIVCEEKYEFEHEEYAKSIEQEIREFNPPMSQGFDEETLKYLYEKESYYSIDPSDFDKQTQVSQQMRGVLVDWLIEVCSEFTLKRETFYLTLHNMDRYFLKSLNQTKSEYQLVGVACLYIACKIEEIYPMKVSDFEQACNYGFTNKQILDKELNIIKVFKAQFLKFQTLKWQINPPTLYLWANWYMSQWDIFYKEQVFPKTNKKVTILKFPIFIQSTTLEFKKATNQSYFIFRQFMTILDCAVLDINTFYFSNRYLQKKD